MVINSFEVGKRVWSWGYRDHGHDKVTVPPQTGGVITGHSSLCGNSLYSVRWDSGQTSTYYARELTSIGNCQTYTDFEGMILKEALRAEKVLGPSGGLRDFVVFLRSGDTAIGCLLLEALLVRADIPIETKKLQRKSRRQ